MAGFDRDTYEDIVRQVVAIDGYVYFDKIMAEVEKRLVATQKPWAVALAHSPKYRRTLRYIMARLRAGGVIACQKAGGDTRWASVR